METAVLSRKYECAGMFNLKFITYLFNPKVLGTLLFLDLTGVLNFITKYIFSDLTYLKFLVVVCFIDLITGIWKVIVAHGIKFVTSKGLRDTVTKIISYGSFLVLIHVLTHFEINGQTNSAFTWLNKAALEFLILIEIKSVYENIIKINPKLDFIDGIIQKIADSIKAKKNASN
jgi:hypothetical protein